MNKHQFCVMFGAVYEHSPWLADLVYDSGIDELNLEPHTLCQRFEKMFMNSSREQQLMVLRAHPELACQRASSQSLTVASSKEQTGAGLDSCSEDEFIQFRELNDKYMNKNKFPFIIAVKGLGRDEILEAMKTRVLNDQESEFKTALQQVNRIARFRIEEILRG
jgi:OHCU decarboxylase